MVIHLAAPLHHHLVVLLLFAFFALVVVGGAIVCIVCAVAFAALDWPCVSLSLSTLVCAQVLYSFIFINISLALYSLASTDKF